VKFGLAIAAASSVAEPALAAEPDPIAKMLDQKQIKYEVDNDKDYKIVYNFTDDKRTQMVYLSGTVEELEGLKIRTIFSPAAELKKNSIDGQFKALLEQNGKSKIGSWEIVGDVLYFTVKLPEPVSADQLAGMLNFAASVADDKEIEISGKADEL
jgi:hypothetical protein